MTNESRCCESVIYQLLRPLCTVSFIRNCVVLKHNKNVPIIFYVAREEHKEYKLEDNSDFRLTQIVVSISCQFTVPDSMQLFIVQFNAVHPLCFRTLNAERSNVQPITVLPLSGTATCFVLNRPSTQRSKPISQCSTYLLNIYSV